VFTLLVFALATASRLHCEQTALGAEPVGWQRCRHQLLEQTRNQIIMFAHGCYGIFPTPEFILLVGLKLKGIPPGVGVLQEVLVKYELPAQG
jgi:hypothetical protein